MFIHRWFTLFTQILFYGITYVVFNILILFYSITCIVFNILILFYSITCVMFNGLFHRRAFFQKLF